MTCGRRRPLHLIVDGLPAQKARAVKDYVKKLDGKLTLYFLPGYAPDLNPDELVWSYAKRTGNARRQLRSVEHLGERAADQLADIGGQRTWFALSSSIQLLPIFLTAEYT